MVSFWILQLCVSICFAADDFIVQTDDGSVRGAANGSCTQFWGIPYAAPPNGSNRFKPPQAATAWMGIRDATQDVQNICMQNWDAGIVNEVTNGHLGRDSFQRAMDLAWGNDGDEDCLFLNVQTPNVKPAELLPVMFYIHGGTNLVGSGSGYNGSSICVRDVVFVSFNYRLGILGNGAFSGALAESQTAGNYGLQDQRMAMTWVQRNIAKFGGDPTRVTISGESAGAMAVGAHLGLARSQNLFSQGIIMSGNDDSLPLTEALDVGSLFAERVGCLKKDSLSVHGNDPVLECLRGKTSEQLIAAQLAVYNQTMRALQVPVADGYELPVNGSLRERFASGKVPAKPLLAGSNLNDSSMFYAFTPREIVRGIVKGDLRHSIDRFLEGANETVRDKVESMYQPAKFGGIQPALYALGSDGYFECPTRRIMRAFTQKNQSVFHYIFAAAPSSPAVALGLPKWLDWFVRNVPPLKWLGAFHGSNEILFWAAEDPTQEVTPQERSLGVRMVTAWTDFVHGRQPWEPYGSQEHYKMLDYPSDSAGSGWHATECDVMQDFRFIWNPITNSLGSGNATADGIERVQLVV